MKLLTILTMGMAWLTTSTALGQGIDRTELFSELNAIRTDRSCNAQDAKKLFYFRKGPKTHTSYQIEKDVLSNLQEVFPDQSFFDVSGLGLLAKLDQGGSDQYVDMIKASLQAVNEPGLYIHADYSNLEDSEMLEIQAWTVEQVGGKLEQACLRRTILFADQEHDLNSVTENNGIIIQGDVNNSGAGTINIIQNLLQQNAFDIKNVSDAISLLVTRSDKLLAQRIIPLNVAIQFDDAVLSTLEDSDDCKYVMDWPNFKSSSYKCYRFSDGQIMRDPQNDRTQYFLEDRIKGHWYHGSWQRPTYSGPSIQIDAGGFNRVSIQLGRDTIAEIKRKFEKAGRNCRYANFDGPRGGRFLLYACDMEGQFSNYDGFIFGEIPYSALPTLVNQNQELDAIPMMVHISTWAGDCYVTDLHGNEGDKQICQLMEPGELSQFLKQSGQELLTTPIEEITFSDALSFLQTRYLSTDRTSDHLASLYRADRKVSYYGKSMSLDRIVRDKLAYFAKWTSAEYWNIDDLQIAAISLNSVEAVFRLNFEVSDNCRRISGVSQNRLILTGSGDDIAIVSESSKVLSKSVKRYC